LLRSADIRDQVAKLSEIAPKFHVFEPPNFGLKGPQISDLFYKSGSPSYMRQSLVTIGQATSEIKRRKKKKERKKDLNENGKTEWPAIMTALTRGLALRRVQTHADLDI